MRSGENSKSVFAEILGEIQHRASDFFEAWAGDRAAVRETVRGLGKRARKFAWEDTLIRALQLVGKLRKIDLDTLKGLKYVVESTIQMYRETLQRRGAGEYEVDDFGLDEDFLDLVRPLFSFLYYKWWRVKATGLENVPSEGPVLLVANHSGVLPFDGAMVAYAVWGEHPAARTVRALYLDWFQSLPIVQPLLARTGQVLACHENGEALLKRGNAVVVFPEGIKGVGKLFKDRYQLARFGRGGFVRMAIRARAPIVPVSVVGAEEIYPNLARADFVAKLVGMPYFPLTPTWPWLGLLGFVPLPTKWHIHFDAPVRTDELAPEKAGNYLVVNRIAHEVRDTIQGRINKLLIQRKGVFV